MSFEDKGVPGSVNFLQILYQTSLCLTLNFVMDYKVEFKFYEGWSEFKDWGVKQVEY